MLGFWLRETHSSGKGVQDQKLQSGTYLGEDDISRY